MKIVNEGTSVMDFLTTYILPELETDNVDERPVVKAAALKFVAAFRSMFDQATLHSLLQRVFPFLNSSQFVVHTYAAATIERVINVRDKDESGRSAPRVSLDELASVAQPLLGAIFGHMEMPTYPANEYLMRCVMRIVVVCGARVEPLAENIITALTTVLERVVKPVAEGGYTRVDASFNHYVFETIASLMRSVCGLRPDDVFKFEAMVFPPFQRILEDDIMEFVPYVFQILAELLDLMPMTAGGGAHALTPGFVSLWGPCLKPEVWLRKGNVPALTELLCSYIRKGAPYILESNTFIELLKVWATRIKTKNEEQFGFAILDAICE